MTMDAAITPLELTASPRGFSAARRSSTCAGNRHSTHDPRRHSRRAAPPPRSGRRAGPARSSRGGRSSSTACAATRSARARRGVARARSRRALSRGRPRALARRGPSRRSRYAAPTRWVTRARPKIDRIACPWLIRRFIDPSAEFFYVPSAEVRAFAAANGATPYDIPDVHYTHVGPDCSFDAFIRLHRSRRSGARRARDDRPRRRHVGARISRRRRPGSSRCRSGCRAMFADDHAMLKWGMLVYDSLYAGAATRRRAGGAACRASRERERPTREPGRAARRRADARRGVPLLAEARLRELRRTRGPDRDHASRSRRPEALDLRAALPARAQLLHGAAGSGGAAARDLHRLAACIGRGAASSRARCSCCRRSSS